MRDRLDPSEDRTAVATRFRHQVLQGKVQLGAPLSGPARLRLTHGWARREFSSAVRRTSDPRLAAIYDPDRVVGYRRGVLNHHTELRLGVDTRSSPPHVSSATPASGWKVAAWAGFSAGVAHDPSRYGRFGADIQRWIDLWHGNRVLRLRGLVEGVVGPADRIPFVDVPTIGGPYFGRGHQRNRYRDRVVAQATVEYQYPVHHRLRAYLFVEPIAVAPDLRAAERRRIRLGYGGGLQAQTHHAFLARVLVSSSLDGGLFFFLNLSPAERGWTSR